MLYTVARSPLLCVFLLLSCFLLFSGYTLLRDPHFNKGLAFTENERDAHYLRGLLPPSVIPQETQVNYLTRKFSEYFNFYYFPKLLDCACAYTQHQFISYCHFIGQVKKMIQHVRQYQVPLQKYMAMMDLQVWPFVQLFFKKILNNAF